MGTVENLSDRVNDIYRREIDTLIFQAERFANQCTIHFPAVEKLWTPDECAEWNKIFHEEMDRLATKRGLRRLAYQVEE